MHPSSRFQMSPDDAITFATRVGVGHLTTSVSGRIESVLIPFIIDRDEVSSTLYGHVSVNNRQASSIEEYAEALVIVDGPMAYVSPSLYPTKAEDGKVVPTLNYVSVQLRGHLAPVTDSVDFRDLLAALTSQYEANRDEPWSISDAPFEFIQTQMRAISGFSMRIDDIQGVAKHSQNRNESDQHSVRSSFMNGTEDERHIAERMN
ncbi:MAG: FMN-binding negative transcriptional regulator [Actinomycetota bacterium]